MAETWSHSADADSSATLTFDDVRKTLDALGPPSTVRSQFAIDDHAPLFPNVPSLYGIPVRISPHGDLDPRPIRHRGWKRFRAWYEAFCRRIGAETPWEHLATMTERSILALADFGFVVGPQTFALLSRVGESKGGSGA